MPHGYAREVEVDEALDFLDLAYEHKLVQFGENPGSFLSDFTSESLKVA
jgi:hypothetical protein